jgi:Holliday junction resolvase RusA-like endonuclease
MLCNVCGWDPSKEAAWSWEQTLDFEYKSGNYWASRGTSGGKYRGYKRNFRRRLKKVLEKGNLRQAKAFRRVTLTRLWGKHQRAIDGDNLVMGGKPLRDVLTEEGLIVDDRPNCCKVFYHQYKRLDSEKPGIIVKLEEF